MVRTWRRAPAALVLVAAVASIGGPATTARGSERASGTSCTICHADSEWVDDAELRKIPESWAHDVHAAAGISCHDCHGGNPDPALAGEMDAAMSADFAPNPFRTTPGPAETPAFCGRCHADPEYMKRFNPAARVDQLEEYWTSRHGALLREGDNHVAVCTSCHGVHGILAADDPRSAVYPVNVAETCGKCHADAGYMAGRTLPDGSPLPVDQLARWRRSVHGLALLERGDLLAPTCNDCHGNHGATPPGLASITYVCGQCHGREAELFRASAKHEGFVEHDEYLASAEPHDCTGCHESGPPAGLRGMTELGECTVCHSNHSIVRPTMALLSPLPETPCAICHGEAGVAEGDIPEPASRRARFQETRDRLLAEAGRLGLEGEERHDWLVDRALELPFHTDIVREEDGRETRAPRTEFGRLFTRFRVGKTGFTYEDPASGHPVTDRVRRCSDCHAEEPDLADVPAGLTASRTMVEKMRWLQTMTGRAERMLLAARRGGVEVGKVQEAVDQAVDAGISLQVLVHSFDVSEDGPFMEAFARGEEHARAALVAGREALDELSVRRRGLYVSIAVIVVTLIGLAVLIRRLSLRADRAAVGAGATSGGHRS